MADDVWDAPQTKTENSDERPSTAAHPTPSDQLDAMDVPKAVFADLQANPMGYAAMGTTYFVAVLGLIVVALSLLGLGVAPGIYLEDEMVLVVGGMLGFTGYTGFILVFSFIGYPLMNASTLRALRTQMEGGEAAGASALFNTMTTEGKSVVGLHLLGQALILVGVFFLYIPGLVAVMVAGMAMPIHVFEPEVGITEALSRSFEHFKANVVWHISIWALMIPVFILLELTVVGLVFIYPVMVAWQLAAYKQAFPNGSAPVGT